MENRRKHIRINKSLEVSFHKVRDFLCSGSREKNVSEGGICLPTPQYFPVGTLLEIEFKVIDFKAPIKALARVVWITNQSNNNNFPFEVGLEFVEILPAQQKILCDYIKQQLSEGGQTGLSLME